MKNEFVPYDMAEKLFNIGCIVNALGYYPSDNFGIIGTKIHLGQPEMKHQKKFDAILYQQAFRWLREDYGWTIKINQILKDEWSFTLENFILEKGLFGGRFNSYQEAQDACLRKLIEIVKEKRDEDNNPR